jgi:hypothetical protein
MESRAPPGDCRTFVGFAALGLISYRKIDRIEYPLVDTALTIGAAVGAFRALRPRWGAWAAFRCGCCLRPASQSDPTGHAARPVSSSGRPWIVHAGTVAVPRSDGRRFSTLIPDAVMNGTLRRLREYRSVLAPGLSLALNPGLSTAPFETFATPGERCKQGFLRSRARTSTRTSRSSCKVEWFQYI